VTRWRNLSAAKAAALSHQPLIVDHVYLEAEGILPIEGQKVGSWASADATGFSMAGRLAPHARGATPG
jgi:hypothetical protein